MVSVPRHGEDHVLIFRIARDEPRTECGYCIQTPNAEDWDPTITDDDEAIRKGMMNIGKMIHDAFMDS